MKDRRHLDGDEVRLRRSFLHYADLDEQASRFKNKLKATFRQAAIAVAGDGIYEEDACREWLARAEQWPSLRRQAEHLFVLVDEIEQMNQETLRGMAQAARKKPGCDLLPAMPGVGPVIGCGYAALIGTPHRFCRSSKLCKHGGLARSITIQTARFTRTGRADQTIAH